MLHQFSGVVIAFGLLAAGLAGAAPAAAAAAAQDESKPAGDAHIAVANFAGGCFWCMQPPFDAVDGVISTTVGCTGGNVPNPSYEQVSAGGTGHAESVEAHYDPSRVSYSKLLDVFWHNVDPLRANGQFCDYGNQ